MTLTLTVRDETVSGGVCSSLALKLPRERITIRELIRERVYQEVQDFNVGTRDRVFRGLVQPADATHLLDGPRTERRDDVAPTVDRPPPIDWRPQFDKAVEAFTRNAFFILVDDRQATSLDEEVELGPTTRISFVRLSLLVGG